MNYGIFFFSLSLLFQRRNWPFTASFYNSSSLTHAHTRERIKGDVFLRKRVCSCACVLQQVMAGRKEALFHISIYEVVVTPGSLLLRRPESAISEQRETERDAERIIYIGYIRECC